ncbi:MAG TPA: hypothetical protein ENG44_02625 [Desulfurococcaceae archaeon]|nr:MAG: hypothetical protein B6U76_08230 [Desulfurococcales archaeon ex4484_217_2]HDJ83875.1 hypothetical protein [Desulfurococcaceae archaeon]
MFTKYITYITITIHGIPSPSYIASQPYHDPEHYRDILASLHATGIIEINPNIHEIRIKDLERLKSIKTYLTLLGSFVKISDFVKELHVQDRFAELIALLASPRVKNKFDIMDILVAASKKAGNLEEFDDTYKLLEEYRVDLEKLDVLQEIAEMYIDWLYQKYHHEVLSEKRHASRLAKALKEIEMLTRLPAFTYKIKNMAYVLVNLFQHPQHETEIHIDEIKAVYDMLGRRLFHAQ